MSEITKGGNDFVGYEYRELHVEESKAPVYLDCYPNFGWIPVDEARSNAATARAGRKPEGKVEIRWKRDRKIVNKMELTRLQRHFDACMDEISALEHAKTAPACAVSIGVGIVGTAFMAGSVFAVTSEPPLILPCIALAVPAFLGWLAPSFLYRAICRRQGQKLDPLIEAKYDEIYEICEKGNQLL